MSKLTGIFSPFFELDSLSATDLNHYLKSQEQAFFLENYIGNRILYPQAIPSSSHDLEIDLAILREYLKQHPEVLYSPKSNKLVVPEEFEIRFPPFSALIGAILDILELDEVTGVVLKKFSGQTEIMGTIVRVLPEESADFIDVNVNGQLFKSELGSVTILPLKEQHIVIQIDRNHPLNVNGGSLGVVIDLRKI